MFEVKNLPPQQLSFSSKNRLWRKKHLDWADSRTFFNYSLVRKSVIHKKINYDLLNGKLHMSDLSVVLNPDNIDAGYIPDKIQHYPIMNSKINVLRGEESKRLFDFKVIITNPNAISEIEENKKAEYQTKLQNILTNMNLSEEEYKVELEKLNEYFQYEWQDLREIRGNAALKHYIKELGIPLTFNNGFMDAVTCGEEIYQCDIVGGEPTLERLNPIKVRIFRSGYSNRIEDADVIVLEDYWSPGKVIDTYYDVLTPSDIRYIENIPSFENASTSSNSMDNYDERDNFILAPSTDGEGIYFDPFAAFSDAGLGSKLYYDSAGNVRVLRIYWKSRRKIKKVKSYNPETGEEIFNFYPETYIINSSLGEEETIFWINEAWEGTKIGAKIYVNMRPRVVQYNRLSNPSRCHFGIIGSIYNFNDQRPFSLIDMMKPYNYLYDAIHDRLNKAIAANWGKLIELDLAQVPKGWEVEKWMYYAKTCKVLVKDSFKEGLKGAATGKLAGGYANNSRGSIDAEIGNHIQQLINLLEFIKLEMSEVAGITRQREGQISNRETVGGVERATLQSSHITEWLFTIHDDVKKRALECFLETFKIALKGGSKKFQYILPDMTSKIMDIDGDEFAESDYGLVVDNSNSTQELNNKLDMLAQAGLQNQMISFSAIMKIYSSMSLAEKQRLIEKDEKAIIARNSQSQQQQVQLQQQNNELTAQFKQEELRIKEDANIRDNETKLLIAQLGNSIQDGINEPAIEYKEELKEKIRQFNERLKLDKDKLSFEKNKHKEELAIKKQANVRSKIK